MGAVTGSLPPVPDDLGDPRPPAAPRIADPWPSTPGPIGYHYVARDLAHHVAGSIEHPLLESVSVRRAGRARYAGRGAIYAGLGSVIVGTVVLASVSPNPTRDLTIFLLVLGSVLVLFFAMFYHSESHQLVQAGARGVANVDGVGEGTVINYYELAAITVLDTEWGRTLRLVEHRGARADLLCGLLEGNPQLWDLVYNGLRHSTAKGAQVDDHTRRLLSLPANGTNPLGRA